MQTDYENLNPFESAVVSFIAVGAVLLSTIVFNGLGVEQQDDFLAALNILDSHEQFSQSIESTNLILGMQEEFHNQFYIAFTQVAVVPEEQANEAIRWSSNIKVAYSQFLNFSDAIAAEYRIQNSPKHQTVYGQRIAGAMIDLTGSLENRPMTKCLKKSLEPPEAKIPYSFEPLEWQPIKQKIINLVPINL